MKYKAIFSIIATLLFIGGVAFVWNEKNLSLYKTQVSEKHMRTSLVKAQTTDPKTLAWNAANRNQRVDLPGNFSIYDQGVHWNDHRLVDADSNTFVLYDSNYAHDSKTVYYQGPMNSDDGEYIYLIQGADVATFQTLHQGYAKDRYHVYLKGEEVKDADPATFSVVSQDLSYFAKDKNFVYKENRRLENIDPEWFRILDGSQLGNKYLVDDKRVWLEAWFKDGNGSLEIREVSGADPETFVILGGVWGKDKKGAFYGTHFLENSDPDTFEVLGTGYEESYKSSYAKDKNTVYFTYKKVENADPISFRVVDGVWLLLDAFGEDDRAAFRNEKLFSKVDLSYFKRGLFPPQVKMLSRHYIEYNGGVYYVSRSTQSADPIVLLDADIETFQVLKNGFARDHTNVFFEDTKIAEDRDGSFEIIKDTYGKDKNSVYYGSKAIKDADPSTFSLLSGSKYRKDKDSVFYEEGSFEVKKLDADVSTFRPIAETYLNYGVDKTHVFVNDKFLYDALPESFVYLGSDYSKDARRVFYQGLVVQDADLKTFSILGDGLTSELGYQGAPTYMSYAKDKDRVFCGYEILDGADPETFTLKGKNGMPRDKLHHYDGCGIRD